MSKFFSVRASDLSRTLAVVDPKTARAMVRRGEARWAGNSSSIILTAAHTLRGLSANPGPKLIERYAMAKNSGQDDAAIVAVEAGWGPR